MEAVVLNFPPEKIGDQAKGNAYFMFCSSLSFCKKHKINPGDYAKFLGQVAAPTWKPVKGEAVSEIIHIFALNLLSVNAEVKLVEASDQQARLVYCWPELEAEFKDMNITADELATFSDIFVPVADYLGMDCTWEHSGSDIVITLKK